MNWLQLFPTTNARILVSLAMGVATTVVYLISALTVKPPAIPWTPSLEWLGFLCVWAGLDVVQYVQKRQTWIPPTTGAPPNEPNTLG